MKKNKGFTLIELLAVIIILGLLMTIAIPSALKIQKNVKEKAYKTKIEMIVNTAKSYGQDNISTIKSSTNYCKPSTNGNSSTWTTTKAADNYPCIRITVNDLVTTNNLNYDEKNICTVGVNGCTADHVNAVVNPVTNNIINKCYVYIFYKNNRVYSVFEKSKCDTAKSSPTVGNEYNKKVQK